MTSWWQALKTQREYDHCEQWWDSKSLHPLQEFYGAALRVFPVCHSLLHQQEHNGSRETKAAHKSFCCCRMTWHLFFFFRKATVRQPIWNYISSAKVKVTLCLLRLIVRLKRSAVTLGQQWDNVSILGHNSKIDLHVALFWLHCKSTDTYMCFL